MADIVESINIGKVLDAKSSLYLHIGPLLFVDSGLLEELVFKFPGPSYRGTEVYTPDLSIFQNRSI